MPGALRLLIIEDSPDDAELMINALEEGGFDVKARRVQTRIQLEEALAEKGWDLVISDYSLPSFDGLQALESVKAVAADLPFIMVSGAVGEGFIVQAMRAGAQDFIVKDHLVRLVPAVRRELAETENRRARRHAEEALKSSELQYRQLIDNLHAGVLVHAPDGRVILSNPVAAELLGDHHTGFHAGGGDGRSLVLLSEDGNPLPAADYPLERVVSTGKPFRNLVLGIQRGESARAWVLVGAFPVRDKRGKLQRVVVTAVDVTERQQAEERIRKSLKDKEILLQEIHHRVKNNMQVIVGLLNLQSSKIEDVKVKGLLKESSSRVNAMALIHDILYRSESLSEIDLKSYLETLSGSVVHMFDGGSVTVRVESEPITLNMDQAIPCGLIINELVSNAIKHGFRGRRGGEIHIEAHRRGPGAFTLIVRDNGPGLPEAIDIQRTDTLGLKLVWGLATQQLGGTVAIERGQGTCFKIELPL